MSDRDIRFLRVTYLKGPNLWTYRPVIEAWLDIGAFEKTPSNQLPGFVERLLTALPGLGLHRCGVGKTGGFKERLEEGTWIGHVLEHVVLELQSMAGMRTGFGKTREIVPDSGLYKMAFRTRNETVGRLALERGRALVLAAVENAPFDVMATVLELTDRVDALCLGPSTSCIVDAATDRQIPSIRLTDGNLVQLGYGCRQRRIWTAETDRTSAIAEYISGDKDLTKTLLSSCGVPVPEGQLVESPDEACEALASMGAPVAVKPVDGNHGRGISLDIRDEGHIREAYALAAEHGSEVLVERFISGNEHRLLVVGGRVVAAARGEVAEVIGDGVGNVQTLVNQQLNNDPRRGLGEEFPLNLVSVETDGAIVLELTRQGLTPSAVPEKGRRVLIQRNGNVSVDCTDDVHPDVAAMAVLAAKIVGLDIAGVDLVAEDIRKPLESQGGAIVEVNAGPGLLAHVKPAIGDPRPVGAAIIEHLFPGGETARIPLIGVSGSKETTETAHLVARLLRVAGDEVGLMCRDGIFVGRRILSRRPGLSFDAGQKVLMNRHVSAAVFESDAKLLLEEGLPYDRSTIAVMMDLELGEELAEYHIRDKGQLFDVMRTAVDVVLPEGAAILNADAEGLAAMAEICDGAVVYFSQFETNEVIAAHLDRGGSAIFRRGDHIIQATGRLECPILSFQDLSGDAKAALSVSAILAAVATGWVLGIAPDLMTTGIETYEREYARSQTARS
jgi:cyanophycin synthetase